MNKIKNNITLFILFLCFLHSSSVVSFAEEKPSEWVIAVNEFKFENAKPIYASYSKIIPQLFLSYLSGKATRLESLSEKKMRELMKSSSKKLKLLKERSRLLQEKDNILLSIEPEKSKKEKYRKLEKQIKDKEIEIEKATLDIKIADNKFYDEGTAKNVVLWQKGNALYKYEESSDLSYRLFKDGISALLLGTLRDASGYLIIKVVLTTGLKGVPTHSFVEAGRYDDAERMVLSIVTQIYTVIQNTREIKLFFDVSPENASVYIDGNPVLDFSKPLSLHEGTYNVEASAEEYVTSTKTILLKEKNYYKLKIDLKKENTAILAFNMGGDPDVFFRTRYYGHAPTQLKISYQSTVVEAEKDGVHTYILIDKDKIPISDFPQNMVVRINQQETKKLVERQRKVMYWSLGAFYVVLPTYLILNSVYNDKKLSYDDGRIPQTPKNEKNIKDLGSASIAMQSIAIIAGINYFAQLIAYLVFADRAIPREPKIVGIDTPKHDISELEPEGVKGTERTGETVPQEKIEDVKENSTKDDL